MKNKIVKFGVFESALDKLKKCFVINNNSSNIFLIKIHSHRAFNKLEAITN